MLSDDRFVHPESRPYDAKISYVVAEVAPLLTRRVTAILVTGENSRIEVIMVENSRVWKLSLGLPLWKDPEFFFHEEGGRWIRFYPKQELENATGGTAKGGRFMESFLEGVWTSESDLELTMFKGKSHEVVYDFQAGHACQANPPFFLLGLAFGLSQWANVQKQLIDTPRPIRMGVFCHTAHWYMSNKVEGEILLRNRNT